MAIRPCHLGRTPGSRQPRARAIGDLLLTRSDGCPQRFYSVSAQIQRERKAYYDILERPQKGSLDVTAWLAWFLDTVLKAVEHANNTLDLVLATAHFWRRMATIPINERQIKVLNRLLDGFEGKLTTSKWAALAKCSQDTALRDITELMQHEVLQRAAAGDAAPIMKFAIVEGAGSAFGQERLLHDFVIQHNSWFAKTIFLRM